MEFDMVVVLLFPRGESEGDALARRLKMARRAVPNDRAENRMVGS